MTEAEKLGISKRTYILRIKDNKNVEERIYKDLWENIEENPDEKARR